MTFQDLTLPVALDLDPVTTSLNLNVPIPVITGGAEIVAIPVPLVYPIPASEINVSPVICSPPSKQKKITDFAISSGVPALFKGVISS